MHRDHLLDRSPDHERWADVHDREPRRVPGKRTLTEGLQWPHEPAVPGPSEARPGAAPTAEAGPRPTMRTLFGSNGRGLDPRARNALETAFATDLGALRVHEGAHVGGLGALAYAEGTNLHFAHGMYDPGSARGLELIAHEVAHVVQQAQGRVSATRQAKGAELNDDPALEREADEWAARAVRGERIFATRGPALGAGAGPIQCKLGIEAEIKRPVATKKGHKLAGDTRLIERDGVRLVSDSRTNQAEESYSNLEMVMTPPFDQLAGSLADAKDGLRARIGQMEALYNEIYADDTIRKLGSLPSVTSGDYTARPIDKKAPDGKTWKSARLRPDLLADGEDDKQMFVHYTIGFPITKMHGAIAEIGSKTRERDSNTNGPIPVPDRSNRPRTHAQHAVEVADELAQDFAASLQDTDLEAFKGMVALVYTQAAAFADMVQGDLTDEYGVLLEDEQQKPFGGGQIKNKTAIVSRIMLGTIYQSLPTKVRALLKTKSITIIKRFMAKLDSTGSNWNPDWIRSNDLGSTKLNGYVNSGLRGSAPVEQQVVFGGMKTLKALDNSGPGGLIPVELRAVGAHYVTWPELYRDAEQWLVWSRSLINGPEAPVAQPPGAPGPGSGPDDGHDFGGPSHSPGHTGMAGGGSPANRGHETFEMGPLVCETFEELFGQLPLGESEQWDRPLELEPQSGPPQSPHLQNEHHQNWHHQHEHHQHEHHQHEHHQHEYHQHDQRFPNSFEEIPHSEAASSEPSFSESSFVDSLFAAPPPPVHVIPPTQVHVIPPPHYVAPPPTNYAPPGMPYPLGLAQQQGAPHKRDFHAAFTQPGTSGDASTSFTGSGQVPKRLRPAQPQVPVMHHAPPAHDLAIPAHAFAMCFTAVAPNGALRGTDGHWYMVVGWDTNGTRFVRRVG